MLPALPIGRLSIQLLARVKRASKSRKVAANKVIFVLGAPGSGKGTQCRNIAEKYAYVHVSAGDLLRKECHKSNSTHGDLITTCFKEGKIVPAPITCGLLQEFIESSKHRHFLIDGFPPNQENREGWDSTMEARCQLLFVLYIECSMDVCLDRCLNRSLASDCDRFDDVLEILHKRLDTHVQETQPIVEYFTDKDLVRRVNGDQPVDDVFNDIQKIFDTYSSVKT